MVTMNKNHQANKIKVCLIKHSPNTISPTNAKYSNGMEKKAQLRSPGVWVRVQFHFVLIDYCDEYEMKSMVNRYLVN